MHICMHILTMYLLDGKIYESYGDNILDNVNYVYDSGKEIFLYMFRYKLKRSCDVFKKNNKFSYTKKNRVI